MIRLQVEYLCLDDMRATYIILSKSKTVFLPKVHNVLKWKSNTPHDAIFLFVFFSQVYKFEGAAADHVPTMRPARLTVSLFLTIKGNQIMLWHSDLLYHLKFNISNMSHKNLFSLEKKKENQVKMRTNKKWETLHQLETKVGKLKTYFEQKYVICMLSV